MDDHEPTQFHCPTDSVHVPPTASSPLGLWPSSWSNISSHSTTMVITEIFEKSQEREPALYSDRDCLCREIVMGRSRESGFEFSSRAPRVKKRRAPDRRNSIDAKLKRHNERRMKLAPVAEEEESEHHVKRGCWSVRLRQRKLVTPVVRYLKRFRRSCTFIATTAAAPFRYYKLDALLAKLHLSRRRSSRKIHSLLTTSSPSDEHAPLLPTLSDPLEV